MEEGLENNNYFYFTYEELKSLTALSLSSAVLYFYFTYEELKCIPLDFLNERNIHFYFTYEELKFLHHLYYRQDIQIFTLPMRN